MAPTNAPMTREKLLVAARGRRTSTLSNFVLFDLTAFMISFLFNLPQG
jgi:hypothetical protein